jgi:hypothetical protein
MWLCLFNFSISLSGVSYFEDIKAQRDFSKLMVNHLDGIGLYGLGSP